MPNIVIVTNRTYMLCESINYMALNEGESDDYYDQVAVKILNIKKDANGNFKRSKDPTKQQQIVLDNSRLYNVSIDYVPIKNGTIGSGTDVVTITVRGKNTAEALFKDIVEQVREQIPDNKFLDALVTRFLSGHIED
jgi:hypothetical protein